MMNLYNLHTDPEKLDSYERRLKVPSVAYEYGKSNGFTDELVSVIAKDAESAYLYAKEVLKKSWHAYPYIAGDISHQAELTIATDARWAFEYAAEVLDETPWHKVRMMPWPDVAHQAELTIAKDVEWAVEYASLVLEEPWQEADVDPEIARQAEETISKDAWWARNYEIIFDIEL